MNMKIAQGFGDKNERAPLHHNQKKKKKTLTLSLVFHELVEDNCCLLYQGRSIKFYLQRRKQPEPGSQVPRVENRIYLYVLNFIDCLLFFLVETLLTVTYRCLGHFNISPNSKGINISQSIHSNGVIMLYCYILAP